MTAASAPVPMTAAPSTGDDRGILVSATVAYPNAWMARISVGHASVATLGGQLRPYTGTAGEQPVGRFVPGGNAPDYTAARSDGSVLGDGAKTIAVNTQERVMLHQPVTGITGIGDTGKLVYLVDDATLTLTKGSAGTLAGTAVGYVRRVETIATTECEVVEFSETQIKQSLIEEGVL